MTTAQVVETSVTVNDNSPIQDYVNPDDQTQPTFEMTPGFKPFTALLTISMEPTPGGGGGGRAKLNSYLDPVLQSPDRSRFVRCWHAKTDGWAASIFHSNCDGKGPTVTIVQVGNYIFGGYTDKSWAGENLISQQT